MNIETLKYEDKKIERLITNLEKEEKKPIYDGIINYEGYFNSKIKILWLLKEPYDTENDGAGGWSLSKLLDKADVYEDFLKSTRSKRTWYPIIYTSYGILKNYKCYEDIEFIHNEPQELTSVLKSIAFININKLAGFSTSKDSELWKVFGQNQEILKKQVDLYNPDIIIGCNTLHIYSKTLGLDTLKPNLSVKGTAFFTKDNKLFIKAYHPSRRDVKRENHVNEDYIDDLIAVYRTTCGK